MSIESFGGEGIPELNDFAKSKVRFFRPAQDEDEDLKFNQSDDISKFNQDDEDLKFNQDGD